MKQKKIHFIGIGGIGMSGIAEVLVNMGYSISGSDLKQSELTDRLKKMGVKVSIGHAEENVSDVDVVVYSNAVPEDNPEIIEARKKSIPIIPRAEMLNELLRIKKGIGIAGTHGKTTTTSMVSFILNDAGWDPTMIIGGVLNTIKSNARMGKGDYLVYEACEAFGSIHYFHGEIVCITNIDKDHMEYYKSLKKLKEAFLSYINRIPFYGFAVLNGDDKNIKTLIPKIGKKYFLFGLDPSNHVYAYDIKKDNFSTVFKVSFMGKPLGEFKLNVPGIHNVYNALAAITIAINLGITKSHIEKSLIQFVNANRRFQFIGEENNITVVDDYAHHPTEIAATIDAGKQLVNGKIKRVITLFQPHLYSRTQLLYKSFAEALSKSDYTLLTEIYPARELPIEGVSSKLIVESFKRRGYKNYFYCPLFDDVLERLVSFLKPGDLVITMGAGNVNTLAPLILEMLKKKSEKAA
ncbi:MAG TPA: UDP-N-acetylmuramate--L-alanine ligase [Spirochaetia bacterium]|nr:MAG: UDP-N-acetylmuramate--L-alanine ligase [Spirochaetes bacterium GWB1_36_13]HCL57363.1 UDP-N-acetylmuramate--L-alanine ligase [Spirochaetia bacterium]